ncbi:hypothetical protein AMK59_2345 [Oryctes borbonicus]|uniref:Uncharacterized protein n=1 Tax=Oryctes borbonicus TaxID=1629725 RepID=A0A0T6BC45_9SCAR|nr:hypothetical protein AMK59_2345 [Oryctes borbonicus]
MRLGRSVEGKPRVLRVVFNNSYSVKDMLRDKRKLESHPTYKHVFVRKDETNYQRDLFKKCQKQMEELKKSGEKDLGIKYVRGIPVVVGDQGSRSNKSGIVVGKTKANQQKNA